MTAQRIRLRDGYVVVTGCERNTGLWAWEILRQTQQLGIKMRGGGFRTEAAAKLAGEKALVALLESISKEESNI